MRMLARIWNRRKLGNQKGQGMTEYVIIVALIAVAAIGVVTAFGDNVRHLFATSTDALAGKSSTSSGASVAGDKLRGSRDLKDFAGEAKKQK